MITPATRTFLVGTTGVGKTLFGYELVGGMTGGAGFLHWTCDRPSRWIIIDGEMPDDLIKERINEVLERHSVSFENLLIYSVGREVSWAPPMPPLNTTEGHAWVLKLAETMKPDGILFDNLMSLSPGNHAEPDTWIKTVPLVMALTRVGIAQVWCDHTGWNADRQYGTSTKAWTFDTVGILKPPPEDQRQEGCLTLNLTFAPPNGKSRRRTPHNWRDFQDVELTLADGEWTGATSLMAAVKKAALTEEGRGWLKDLTNMFAIPDLPQERTVTPFGA